MVLVRRVDDSEGLAGRLGADPDRRGTRERRPQQRLDHGDGVLRQADRAGAGARAAHRSPARREIPDEIALGTALDTAPEVRQIAGEPQELQLEPERQRVDGRTGRQRGQLVERVQEPCERRERPLVRLLLGVEPQHRLQPDQPDLQAIRVRARAVVRADEGGAGHRVELAAAVMEDELDVRERLEPPAEPRLGLPHPFRHRAYPAAVERVEMEDAIGLAELERTEDDGLGRIRTGHARGV